MQTAVIIMSRAPRPGETKTRLMSVLSARECADFHRAVLGDLCGAVRRSGLPGFLYYTDDQVGAAHASCPNLRSDPWLLSKADAGCLQLRAQTGQDLGERMKFAALEVLAEYDAAILTGSDLPTLGSRHFLQAATLLEQHDLVLGPALDGGYYLMGLKQVYDGLFEGIAWSTPAVLAETMARADALNISLTLLEPLADIDTWQDLKEFVQAGMKDPAAYEPLAAFQYARSIWDKYNDGGF